MRSLTTSNDIIDELGGTGVVARWLGISAQSVSEWRANGAISPRFYLMMLHALRQRGCIASPELWKIKTAA